MDEMFKPERCECNVYITVNCDCKDEKKPPCFDKEKECKECNVYITVNCGKEDKKPR